MSKTQLRLKLDIGSATMAKMSKNEPVSLSTLCKMCDLFNCNIGDLIDYKREDEDNDE